MTTKAELEQKVSDLQAVLTAVQDERETLRHDLTVARGKAAALDRELDKASDEIAELKNELGDGDRQTHEHILDEITVAKEDRERLLRILDLSEADWALRRDSLDTLLGKVRYP